MFKTLMRNTLGRGPVHLHTLHILKATTGYTVRKSWRAPCFWRRNLLEL